MTEFFLGKRARHSYAIETAYGTAAPAITHSWMGVIQSISPTSKSELFQINAMDDTDSRNVSEYIETLRSYAGSIEFLVQHCRPLLLGYGTDTFDDAAAPVYTHTFVEGDTLKSFTLNFGYQHTAAHAVDYTGCVVNRMDIECSKGEFMKCTLDFVAQTGTDQAFRDYQASNKAQKEYPTVGTGAITPFSYSDAIVTINGTTYTPETVKMSLNNNLLSEPVLDSINSKRIAEPIPQLREYEASMTLKMATDDLYDLWETGTYATIDPTITFTRTAVSDLVVFTLEDAVLESAISPYNINDGIVVVELPFKVKKIGIVETNAIDVDYDIVEA